MTEQTTIAEQVEELAAALGCTRKEARKHLMRSRTTGCDGISRLTHRDPTPVEALRNIERSAARRPRS
ncbi:hypothetical protein [Sinomonas sp. P10A9]|uniref:Uncharacterized protein n=1 Tax=Sinomonas puerhi TaxID=3238584 RepID=A0AB39KYN5_9MICC